jgi:hypothetical protein
MVLCYVHALTHWRSASGGRTPETYGLMHQRWSGAWMVAAFPAFAFVAVIVVMAAICLRRMFGSIGTADAW